MSSSITLEQIINFLLEAPMFGDLDPGELSEIVHIMQVQRFREGQEIFHEGDAGDAWFVIFDGEADVFKSEDFAPARRIARIGPRACFGEMAILDHSPRSATITAIGDTTVFRFPRKDFERLLKDGNLAAYKLIYEMAKVLCVRARNTTQQLTEALAQTSHERLHRTSVSVVEGQSLSE
jgi:CRP-like cAMP-binding protein